MKISGKEYLRLQRTKHSMSFLKPFPKVSGIPDWQTKKPICKMIYRIPFTKIIVFKNGQVFEYYIKKGKLQWQYIYSLLKLNPQY